MDESAATELKHLIEKDDRRGEDHDPGPIVPGEGNDAEDLVADGDVEDHEVGDHREHAREDEPRVRPPCQD